MAEIGDIFRMRLNDGTKIECEVVDFTTRGFKMRETETTWRRKKVRTRYYCKSDLYGRDGRLYPMWEYVQRSV